MQKDRLEIFSDGVIAIIITIMVLEMKVPHGAELSDVLTLLPVFTSYILSFVYIGIYWSNHHHLLYAVKNIDSVVLWANLHLLFWLSLMPFATGWMGENHFAPYPVALYGVVLLMAAIAYFLLVLSIGRKNASPDIHQALGNKIKERASIALYLIAIGGTFIHTSIAEAIYVLVAALWFIPDRRIEKAYITHKDD